MPALRGVDLTLGPSEVVAVVGRSGAGKSTLGRCLALLEPTDSGEVLLDGRPVGPDLPAARRAIQLVFQDPARSLNLRLRVGEIVTEPMRLAGMARAERCRRGRALLEGVHLPGELMERRPLDLSGGQRQRLAVARALATEPKVLILDEAVAGLDPSIQGHVVNLIEELRLKHGLGVIWISHDAALMAHVADRVAVLDAGRIVEQGPAREVLGAPRHPVSAALVGGAAPPVGGTAAPEADAATSVSRALLRRGGLRLLHGALLAFTVSFLTFLLMHLAPGDYLERIRADPRIPQETLEALEQRFCLDCPFLRRYGLWLGSVARGELGYSIVYGPVKRVLWERTGYTLLLTASATLLSWLLALVLGGCWAIARSGPFDRIMAAATAALLSVPGIVIALALLAVAARVPWLPVGGVEGSLGRHLLLPVVAVAASLLPSLVRHVRGALAEALAAPFALAARAHGIGPLQLALRHALPVAANPLLSLLGLSVAGLLSASLVVEVIFSWPGLGSLTVQAIRNNDPHLVIAPLLASTLLLVGGNLAADLLLVLNDPRVRTEEPR